MAQAIRYKRPRKLNVVSLSLLAAFVSAVVVASEYLPMYLRKQEAYRVLDETSSTFAGQKHRYLKDPASLEQLTHKMAAELRRLGIDDPDMEHWIEPENDHTIRFGVVYTEVLTWPFDLVGPHEKEIQAEYVLTLTQ